MRLHSPVLKLAFLLLLVLPCTSLGQDLLPGESWQRYADPSEAGFSKEGLEELERYCESKDIDGLLVIHDGAVLMRHGDIERRFMCHSVRKSFMSILYGIYLAEGSIDLDRTLAELGIDDIEPKLSDEEKRAKVKDLLSARSGVYHPAAYEPESMKRNRPERGSHAPGTYWWYNNWDFNALLTIFERETERQFFEAFQERLARPLQMQDFRLRDGYYHLEPEQSEHAAYPFRMSARDMARIGLLMLRSGRWGEHRIVPQNWAFESTRAQSDIEPWQGYRAYGYLWWISGEGRDLLYSALGTGNNSIDVMPGHKLVFVFRANTFRGRTVAWRDRWKVIRGVVKARTGARSADPKVVPLEDRSRAPKAVALSDAYLEQFPLELPRALPEELPAAQGVPPVRIERGAEGLVLFTQPPPAMQLDLIPLGEDRFFLEGAEEIGAIDRDAEGRPVRFVLKVGLRARIIELRGAGRDEEAAAENGLYEKLFGAEAGAGK
ncbi:MAG: serine hydrolase [Planctomycetota bacterium]